MRRAARALACTLLGWLAAYTATLPFQLLELGENASRGLAVHNLAEGLGLWGSFTLVVCAGAGLAIALPASILAPSELVRRYRWRVIVVATIFSVYLVGHRLGTWTVLFEDTGGNPFRSRIFWMYSIFAAMFAHVTVLSYARNPVDHG